MLQDLKIGDWVILNEDYTDIYKCGFIGRIKSIQDVFADSTILGQLLYIENHKGCTAFSYRFGPIVLTELEKILYNKLTKEYP